jgi:hypothetical protein
MGNIQQVLREQHVEKKGELQDYYLPIDPVASFKNVLEMDGSI